MYERYQRAPENEPDERELYILADNMVEADFRWNVAQLKKKVRKHTRHLAELTAWGEAKGWQRQDEASV